MNGGWLALLYLVLKDIPIIADKGTAIWNAISSAYASWKSAREQKSRDSNVDKAVDSKNPDDLEKSLRNGGGGA